MVRVLIRLKWRLLVNGFKKQTVGGFVYVMIAIAGLAFAALITDFLVNGGEEWTLGQRSDVAIAGLGVLTLLWFFLPLLNANTDGTLEPSRFVLLPLTPRKAVPGMLLSSFVGIAPWVTLIPVVSLAVHGPTALSRALLVIVLITQTLFCVLAARLSTTMMAGLLQDRRTKDVSSTIMTIVAATAGIGFQLLIRAGRTYVTWPRVESAADVLAWTPLGIGGRAVTAAYEGHLARSLGWYAGLVVMLAVVGWVWWRMTARNLTTIAPGRKRDAAAHSRLTPRWLPSATSPARAVMAREFRYLARHPAARAEMLMSTMLMVAMAVGPLVFGAVANREPRFVIGAATAVAAVGLSSTNVLGMDAKASWGDALGTTYPIVLTGKAMARGLLGMVLALVVGVIVSTYTGGWIYLLAVPFVAAGAGACFLSVGMIASLLNPMPLPDQAPGDPFSQPQGQGCLAGLISLVAVLAGWLIAIPIAAMTVVATVFSPLALIVVCPLALAYGWIVWRIALRILDDRATARLPELVNQLSR